jgi:hypothetical protein
MFDFFFFLGVNDRTVNSLEEIDILGSDINGDLSRILNVPFHEISAAKIALGTPFFFLGEKNFLLYSIFRNNLF